MAEEENGDLWQAAADTIEIANHLRKISGEREDNGLGGYKLTDAEAILAASNILPAVYRKREDK